MSFHIKQTTVRAMLISTFPTGESLGLWGSYQTIQ